MAYIVGSGIGLFPFQQFQDGGPCCDVTKSKVTVYSSLYLTMRRMMVRWVRAGRGLGQGGGV